jgi:hypothetical protein
VICALGSELVEPFIQEIYSRAMQTLQTIEITVKSLSTESAKDLWDQKDDFLIRSTELLHAINATLKQKMSFLFAYDNYALL